MKTQAFKFKQFKIEQDKCAMKVNTDGVLLGAWASIKGAVNILDIGTGTGVLALMLAQKNEQAFIDAIDIDKDAYLQAKSNFENSSWANRVKVYHTSLQIYLPTKKYDVIISNPPYFVDDFKSDNKQKNIARHSIELNYEDLLKYSSLFLHDNGHLFLVIPVFNLPLLKTIAQTYNLYVTELLEVTAQLGKQPYLVLLNLERTEKTVEKSELIIQSSAGIFTEAYKQLTRNFYLKF